MKEPDHLAPLYSEIDFPGAFREARDWVGWAARRATVGLLRHTLWCIGVVIEGTAVAAAAALGARSDPIPVPVRSR